MPSFWPRLLILVLLLQGSVKGLFEDQAFKFDWRRRMVGKPEAARFWETSQGDSSLIVRSSSSILASLDSGSGDLSWRHVGELGEKTLDLTVSEKTVASISYVPSSSFHGNHRVALRLWSPQTGSLTSELLVSVPEEPSGDSFIHGTEANIVSYDQKSGTLTARVFVFKKSSAGEELRSVKLPMGLLDGPLSPPSCSSTRDALFCLHGTTLYHTALPLQDEDGAKKASMSATSISALGAPAGAAPVSFRGVPGTKDVVQIVIQTPSGSEEILLVKSESGKMTGANTLKRRRENSDSKRAVAAVTGCKNNQDLLFIQQNCSDDDCQTFEPVIKVFRVNDDKRAEVEKEFEYQFSVGRIEQAWATCQESSYQLVVSTSDGTVTSFLSNNGRAIWSREEALAEISEVQMLATALQDDDGTYDSDTAEHSGNEAKDVMGQFLKRIRHHSSLLNHAFTRILETRDLKEFFMGGVDTSYDDFGLRKVIVAVGGQGRLLGLDSVSGEIIWRLNFPGQSASDDGDMNLFVQRSALHFGFDAHCTLLYRNGYSSLPELLVFNPLDGQVIRKKQLRADFTQAILLHHITEEHLRPMLLLHGPSGPVELDPPSVAKTYLPAIKDKTFIVTTDKKTATIKGQKLVVGDDNSLRLLPIWSLSNPNTQLVTIAGKNSEEKVHSQGRVMADRSVLFKYVNPNLALVLTEGKDSSGKGFINVYLADMVTGGVVFSANHKRVTGPYHVVHSENWAVYTYFNEKARRGELISIELFEGKTQSNSTVFSSLSSAPTAPLVERQAFILGGATAHVSALKDTTTEKGITTKNILMATASGAVYSVPRVFVDPRRPNFNTPAENREPGLPPYIPELSLPSESVLNYNQSVVLPRGIVAAPTGLESTSIVFVYGLDIYCTRVTPSKGFDLLKDDFDHYVISLVLFALVAVAYGSRKLSQRKNLKQAWR